MGFPVRAQVYLAVTTVLALGFLAGTIVRWRGPLPSRYGLIMLLVALAVAAQHFGVDPHWWTPDAFA